MSQTNFVLLALVAIATVANAVNVADSGFSISAPDNSTFRTDYFFHEEADGWLKFHRVPTSWAQARATCRLEGARLASPINRGVYATLRFLAQAARVKAIYTGIHSMSHTTDYVSVEGVHISQMPIEWSVDQPSNVGDAERCLILGDGGRLADVNCNSLNAFFCYKQKVGQMAMNRCGNSDNGYTYNPVTGSCYKVHPQTATWAQAHTTCTTEGGHLAIVNNNAEAQVINDIGTRLSGAEYMFLGFVNWYRQEGLDISQWRTIQGQTLLEAGWVGWLPGEPNNYEDREYCGTMTWRGQHRQMGYADYPCEYLIPFICEIERPRSPLWW